MDIAAVIALATTLASCGSGSGDSGSTGQPAQASATIGPSGGTLQGPDGVQLVVPAGALSSNVTLTITRSSAGAPAFNDTLAALPNPVIYEVTPHGQGFMLPVHLSFPVTTTNDVAVFNAELNGEWSTLPVTVADGMAQVDVMSLSWFGPVYPMYGACSYNQNSPPWICLSLGIDKATILAPPGAVQMPATSGPQNLNEPLAVQAGPLTLSVEVKAPYVCGASGAQASVEQRWFNPSVGLASQTTSTLMTNAPVALNSASSDPKYRLGTLNIPITLDASLNGRLTYAMKLHCLGTPGGLYSGGGYAVIDVAISAATPAPTISTQPANQTASAGQSVTFSVRASATGTLSANWQRSNDGGATWSALLTGTPVSGGSDFTFTAAQTDQGALFRAQVCNFDAQGLSACATSNAASLTVTATNQAPIIAVQPSAQTFGAGGSAVFSVQATGSAPLAYAWTLGGAALPAAPGGGAFTQGACTAGVSYPDGGASVRLTSIAAGCDGMSMAVTVSNGWGSVSSGGAALSVVASSWQVTTLAGRGFNGSADGIGSVATFSNPRGVSVDSAGNIYVADYTNNEIRKVTPSGVVTTLAGSTTMGSADGTGTSASFAEPYATAVDIAGNIYVSDSGNSKIRKVSPTGVVTTFAGSGIQGHSDGTGSSATFLFPSGVAIDAAGNLYVADGAMVRKITPTAVVTTLAGSTTAGNADGTGAAASFGLVEGIAVDTSGNVYVTDIGGGNQEIRKITPAGVVTTIAGSTTLGAADGLGTSATFSSPSGIAVDPAGNLYVADTNNNSIRKITPAGLVTTIAGSTTAGHADGTGAAASFYNPMGIAVDASGNLYVADFNNDKIREITPPATAAMVTANAGGGAGSIYSTYVNAPVTLDASASTDSLNLPLSWAWDLNGDGVFGDATGSRTTLSFPNFGVYQVAVKVTDTQGASDIAYAYVNVRDHAPTANAGGPYAGVVGNTIVLDGSLSTDADLGDTLSYAWDLVGTGLFADGNTAKVNFTVPGPVSKASNVCLRVTDTSGKSNTACSIVTAMSAQPPVADAGGGSTHAYTGVAGRAVALDATASTDPQNRALSYSWAVTGGGVLSDATAAQPTVIFGAAGSYVVTVTVSNGVVASTASATVTVSP